MSIKTTDIYDQLRNNFFLGPLLAQSGHCVYILITTDRAEC